VSSITVVDAILRTFNVDSWLTRVVFPLGLLSCLNMYFFNAGLQSNQRKGWPSKRA